MACAAPVSLCYVSQLLPIWGLLCGGWRVKGGTDGVVRCSVCDEAPQQQCMCIFIFTVGPCFKHVLSRFSTINTKERKVTSLYPK